MLSPLKPNQTLTTPSLSSENLQLSSTYEYPKVYNFLSTPSIQYKNRNQLKESLSSFYFPVFDLSKTNMMEARQKEAKTQNQDNKQETKRDDKKISSFSEINGYNVDIQQCSKPEPFMGAFLQTQRQFGFFNLNIKIPTLNQVKPFSRILSQSIVKQVQQQQNDQNTKKQTIKKEVERKENSKQKKDNNLLQSLLNSENQAESEYEQSNLYNLDLSVSKIDEQIQPQEQLSNLWQDYESKSAYLEASHRHFLNQQMWQSNTSGKSYFNHTYEFHLSKCSEFINRIQNKSVLTQKEHHFSEGDIVSCVVKMLLGVESELFKLEYHTLTWSLNSHLCIKLEHILKSSLENYLQDILLISNYKSRLQTCLNHVKKQSYRRILQQTCLQTKQFLLIMQEIALELLENKQTLVNFVIALTEMKPIVALIYELLINQAWVKTENKSYIDFDVSFLNSEAVIFRQIVRMSNNNDMLFGKSYQLSLKILRAAFKPITFTLNRIVFEEITEISNRDDTYLRFYFQNLKDLLSYLGKRIDLIKQQSNQLYMICRTKQKIEIIVESTQLQQYIKRWDNLFSTKRKMIESIQSRQKKRLKEIKQKQEEQKIKEIYQLKKKLLKSIEQTKQRKSQIYQEGLKEIEKLKKDIAERQERRRLNYLIEKEQQKGFLLDAELKEKRNLIHQKEELLEKAEKQGLELVHKIVMENQPKQKGNKEQIKKQVQKNETVKTQSISQKAKIQTKQIDNSKSQIGFKTEISLDQSKQYSKQDIKKQQTVVGESVNEIKRISKMSSISISVQQKRQSESQVQQPVEAVSQSQQINIVSQNLHVSTNTVLQLCIDSILRQQIEITNLSMSYLIYDKYQLLSIMQFMRKIFLNGNGEGLTNMIHLSINNESKINLHYFRDCLLFDIGDSFIRELGPEFYEVHALVGGSAHGGKAVNIFQDSLDVFVGFQFSKLPVILQPYFSYIHLSKYMQIFSYILKINHCLQLTSSCLLLLNQHSPQQSRQQPVQSALVQKLYLTRYSIHIFLNTLQSYLFHRIIEKELKILRTKLKNRDVNELAIVHLNMLDCIIRKGLIENNFNDISKKIRALFMEIRKFKNIVDSFCANDIHSYIKPQIQAQVEGMFRLFREQQVFLESLFYHP